MEPSAETVRTASARPRSDADDAEPTDSAGDDATDDAGAAEARGGPAEGEIVLSIQRCPFCRDSVSPEGGETVACLRCLARHHASCWRESTRCGSCGDDRVLGRPQPPLTVGRSPPPFRTLRAWREQSSVQDRTARSRAPASRARRLALAGGACLLALAGYLISEVRSLEARLAEARSAELRSAQRAWSLEQDLRWEKERAAREEQEREDEWRRVREAARPGGPHAPGVAFAPTTFEIEANAKDGYQAIPGLPGGFLGLWGHDDGSHVHTAFAVYGEELSQSLSPEGERAYEVTNGGFVYRVALVTDARPGSRVEVTRAPVRDGE